MKTNEIIVKILADRILNGGINPLKNRPFELEDVTNVDYRQAVENYIILQSGAIEEANVLA